MLKLVASDDTLSINDGDMILSRWVCDSHSGKIMVRDAFGFPITESKLPVETQNGIRTEASDVIADIGANFKGIDLSYYYQWLFPSKSGQIYQDGTDIIAKNYGTGLVNGLIKNVQVATFSGTSYLTFVNLNGATIVSSFGTSTPSKVNDQRINFTAGTCWGLLLSNGSFIPMCEGQGITNNDRKGIHNATIVGATLSVHWGTKVNTALPYMFTFGGSQYLVCSTAGTTSHLALTDNSNVGVEKIVNGSFDTGDFTGWSFNGTGTPTIVTNSYFIQAANLISSSFLFYGLIQNVLTIGKTYQVKLKYRTNATNIRIAENGGVTLASINVSDEEVHIVNLFFTATVIGFSVYIGNQINKYLQLDDISIKEITDIDLTAQTNIWSAKVKPVGIIDWYFINSTKNKLGNGYMLRITPTAITLYRNDAGTLVQLDTESMTVNAYDEITITDLTVKVNGVEKLTSTDGTYTTMKTMTIDADASDELLSIYYNGKRFNPYNFVNDTGVYGVQNIINVEG